jgi:hypothetical protein
MLKNLKSLFVTTEEEPAAGTTPPSAKSDSKEPATAPDPKPAGTPQVDNAILDRLLKALEDNNQAGFDYLEYRRSLKSLAALPMDEATKFRSAFATASTMDVTLEKLLGSIDFYRKVLKNEEDNFNRASKEQFATNVESKIREQEKLNSVIKEKSAAIQKLTEEIRKHHNDLQELSKFVENAQAKINETAGSFDHALKYLIGQLDQDAEKLRQYLK